MIISVIGGSNAKPEHLTLAEAVGRELAGRNVMVACGGLKGVMEAVCRGAKSAGGTTIGILPGRSSLDANSFVDIPIVTSMGYGCLSHDRCHDGKIVKAERPQRGYFKRSTAHSGVHRVQSSDNRTQSHNARNHVGEGLDQSRARRRLRCVEQGFGNQHTRNARVASEGLVCRRHLVGMQANACNADVGATKNTLSNG